MRYLISGAVLLLISVGCSEPPPAESDIRAALDDVEAAVEANEPQGVLDRLHDDFSFNRSGREMSRWETSRLLKMTLKRHQNVGLVLTNVRVEPDAVRADLARVKFNAVVTSSSRSRLLPEDGSLYRVDSEWRLDGDWKLHRLESRRALE